MDRRRIRALHLAPGPTAPHLARKAIRRLLAGRDADTVERALLLTSEAVTNAVIHAATDITVDAHVANDRLWVVVEDGDERAPTPIVPRGARGGFGLHIIDELADGWGVAPTDDGKAVWFEMSLAGAREERHTVGGGRLSNARS